MLATAVKSRFRLSIRHLWLLIPFVFLAWVTGRELGDNSFLWHVRAGTLQLQEGEVLAADPFSFTAFGEPWRTQSWLVELGFGWAENLTSGVGWVPYMVFGAAALTLATIGLSVHRSTKQVLATTVALIVVAWQAAPFTNPRPVLFSYLALALLVLLLQRRRHPDSWAIPPLMWVWAAVHGSFVLGIGFLVLEAWRRGSRRLLGVAAASVAVASLTAHGLGIWQILIDFLGARGALELIDEWKTPDFTNPFVIPYALAVVGVIVASARGRVRPRDLIVIVPFLLFGLLAMRNLYPAMIVLAPWAALALVREKAVVRKREDKELVNWAIVGVVVVFMLVAVARPSQLDPKRFPVHGAMDHVTQEPLFHGTAVGGYLIYDEWPDRLVFIDDRAELYGSEAFVEFKELAAIGTGYEEVFARYGLRQALLEPDYPLVELLARDGWQERFRDDNWVVMQAPA